MTKSTPGWGLPTAVLAEDLFEGTRRPASWDLTWMSRPVDEPADGDEAPTEREGT